MGPRRAGGLTIGGWAHAILGRRGARGQDDSGEPGADAASKDIPDEVKPIAEWATFVVSTWFSSIVHPLFRALRRDRGQRWVKITHFRSLDMLNTEAAAFPLDVLGALMVATAARCPRNENVTLRVTDPRGTDLKIKLSPKDVDRLLKKTYCVGELTAASPGAYVHYLPTHGPNLYAESVFDDFHPFVEGIVRPQWLLGFAQRSEEAPEIEVRGNRVTRVGGASPEAAVLREMLAGSYISKVGCGFNPKWPRDQIYPAGPNSPGTIHIGFDRAKESTFIRRVMPDWPEPPLHYDVADLDATVTWNDNSVIVDKGFLVALRDPAVRALAARYGDPVYLLEAWPTVESLGVRQR